MGIWYCTREDVKTATDAASTARNDAQIDSAIEAGSRALEDVCHRVFYPMIDVRTMDWPGDQTPRSWHLNLEENELLSLTSVVSGGVTIPSTDYILRPSNATAFGKPYTDLEINLSKPSGLGGGATPQNDITLSGTFAGCTVDEGPAGSLAVGVDGSVGIWTVTDGSAIGVGSLLRCGTERATVSAKGWATSSQTLQSTIDAKQSTGSISVTTGSAFAVGEQILIESEIMRIDVIAGNVLTVTRAYDGSTLAAHNSGATIYVNRVLTVSRGVLGTTAAAHSISAPVYVYRVPGLIHELAIAEAQTTTQQKLSNYARQSGSGDSQAAISGRGITDIRAQVWAHHARKARNRAV